ncbi:MAG: hypothetical protein IMF16_01055 [Proteobacteria bacterium]|nr:hypothetical protein [Pseudomonadota bacterium]
MVRLAWLWGTLKSMWGGITKVQRLLAAVVALIAVVSGWPATHKLNLQRDVEAKQRDIQVQYLIEAYGRLERATGREEPGFETDKEHLQHTQDVERALGDIQLFGTPEEVDLAKGVIVSLAAEGRQGVSVTPLLQCLRRDLRQKLLLRPLEDEPPLQLRFTRDNPAETALPPAQEP